MTSYDPAVATAPCVKCGGAGGRRPIFIAAEREYIANYLIETEEYLRWPCGNCGHILITQTKDASPDKASVESPSQP